MGHSSVGNSPARSSVASSRKGVKQLPYAEFLKRKEEGRCFRCGLKYGPLHKCPQRQLQVLIMAEELDGKEEGEFVLVEKENKLEEGELIETEEEDLELNLQVMRGVSEPHTLKIHGSIAGVPVTALIDSGASHNFLSDEVANRLRLKGDQRNAFWVKLGDGSKKRTRGECKAISLCLEGVEVLADFHIFPLGGVDIILGVSWLRTLGNINFNWDTLTMEFKHGGQRVLVKGIPRMEDLKLQENSQVVLTEAGLWGLLLGTSQWQQPSDQEKRDDADSTTAEIQNILGRFKDVFEDPQGLPPTRKHEHKIQLKEGVDLINVRPYRYAHLQKNEMEKLVKEMLKSGIIRVSHSPYSNPIILVRKKKWLMEVLCGL